MSAAVTLAMLFFWSVALNEQVTEGCTCLVKHPQQQFCESDLVIRAKIIGTVPNTQHPQLTAHKIQTIKVFKQLNQAVQVIYTSFGPCGRNLNNGDYLLSGHVSEGVVVVSLCDRVELWDSISSVQKQYLSMYQRGCVCEISPCTGASCLIKILQKKCLMRVNDEVALQSICLPDNGGFCKWHEYPFVATKAVNK